MSLESLNPLEHVTGLLAPIGFQSVGGAITLPAPVIAEIDSWYDTSSTAWDGVKALTGQWTLYMDLAGDYPHNSVCLISSGGTSPNPRWLLEYPSFQVLVNGSANNIAEARQIAEIVKRRFVGMPSHFGAYGDRYVMCTMDGDIGYLGLDSKGRPQYSLNFSLIIEPIKRPGDHRDPI